MKVVFDAARDAVNRKKHGVSLAIGLTILRNRVGERPAPDIYDEPCRVAYGLVEGRLLACVYTVRGDSYRIISVRPANRSERKRWLT